MRASSVLAAWAVLWSGIASAQNAPATLVMLPPHHRMARAYPGLDELLSLRVTGVLQRAGVAVPVNRDYLGPLLTEKHMARAELTDAVALGRAHRLIGADYTAFTSIDRVEGELVVTTDLIPAEHTDVADPYGAAPRRFPQVRTTGRPDQSAALMTEHARRLGQRLPEAKPTSGAEAALPPGLRIGALPVAAYPATDEPWRGAVSDVAAASLSTTASMRQVDREALDAVLAEHALALSGLTLRDRSQRAGALMGAELMLIGGVIEHAGAYDLELQLLDVATGAVIASASGGGVAPENLLESAQTLGVQLAQVSGVAWSRVRALEADKPAMQPEGLTLAVRAAELMYYGSSDRAARAETARRLAEAALDLSPDSPDTLRYAGWTHNQLKEYDTGERLYRRAVELAPNDAMTQQQLGILLDVVLKRPAEALPYLQRAMELDTSGGMFMWRRFYVARCLLHLDRSDEALPLLLEAEAHWNNQPALYDLLGNVYEAMDDHARAGHWYERSARFGTVNEAKWVRALEAYRRAGDTVKTAHMVEMQTRHANRIRRDDWPVMLPLLAAGMPHDAAVLCYRLIDLDHEIVLARHTLAQLGYPAEHPPITGPAFDAEALRQRGVFVYLQPYTDFRYPDRVAFMGRYIEDTLGVPVRVAQTPHEHAPSDYKRNLDRVDPHLATDKDLAKLGKAHGATALVALTSLQIRTGWSGFRWQEDVRGEGVGCGLVTSEVYDDDVTRFEHDDATLASISVAWLQRMTLKYAALNLLPPGEPRSKECLGDRCPLTKWTGKNESQHLLRVPCLACRHRLRTERPDWPRGDDDRPPIEAGPRTAALTGEPAKPVLLLGVGATRAELNLDAAAQAIAASTGMPVVVEVQSTLPDLPRVDNEYPRLRWGDLKRWTARQARRHDVTAVCVVIADNVVENRAMLANWLLQRPGEAADDPPCPVLIVPIGRDRWAHWALPQSLRHTETVTLDGRAAQAPQYAKLLIGGLTVAARDTDTPCWTYGCPGTLWHDLTPLHRASPWLCGTCRAALHVAHQHGNREAE